MSPESCAQGSVCFELIKGVPTALVAFIIGLLGAYVAWKQKDIARQQKEIAEAKLKLDLFGRRYDMYLKVSSFIKDVASHGTHQYPELYDPFKDILAEADFLFGEDVFNFLIQVTCHFVTLQGGQIREEQPDFLVPERHENNYEDYYQAWREVETAKEWFRLDGYKDLRNAFGPYLSFRQWK